MKITAIKPYPVWVGTRNQLVVKVETDQGIYGWGESGLSGREKAVVGAIRGGNPYHVTRTSELCAIYLDCRLTPNSDPLALRRELREQGFAEMDSVAFAEWTEEGELRAIGYAPSHSPPTTD